MTTDYHTIQRSTLPIIAIDPGIHGGFVITTDPDWCSVTAVPFHSGCTARLNQLRDCVRHYKPALAILEDVGLHRTGNSAQASATLAKEVGRIEAALHCFDIPVYWVTPKEWRNTHPYSDIPKSVRAKAGAVLNPSEAKRINAAQDRGQKAAIAEMSRALYPGMEGKINLATADAVALYWYASVNPNVASAVERMQGVVR